MGKKEWKRQDSREKALQLVRAGRPLSDEEIALVKSCYSGIGGLCRSEWSRGAFFTPPVVVDFVHSLICIKESPGSILEPAIGSGAFIEGLPSSLVTGIEPNRDSFRVAEICYPEATLLNANAEDIFPCDKPGDLDGKFDYCVSNPPYGLKTSWGGEIVGGRWRKIPSEWLFMEIAYRAVRPGGAIAYVVPDGILSNSNSQAVRDWLLERCYLKAVISLPMETFFHAGTSVKSSVVFLQKHPQGITRDKVVDYPIFMALCKQIGWDSRGRPTNKCDLPTILQAWHKFKITGRVPGDEQEHQEAAQDISPVPPVPHQVKNEPSNSEEETAPLGQLTLFG